MKILSVRIKNFRPVKEVTIFGPEEDVWTFVGQNNAGKSSVFTAIRAFYGSYKIGLEDFNKLGNEDDPIEIEIEYRLDTEEERRTLPEYYLLPRNRLRVLKRFTKDNLKGTGRGFEFKDGKEVEREEEFFGAKNVQIGKLGDVIFIPAIKDLSEELKNNNYSLFRKLIARIITEALSALPSYANLERNAEKFISDLRSPVKRSTNNEIRSIDEIEESLDGQLDSWGIKTNIQINPPTPEDIITGGASLRFINKITNLEEDPLLMGSGAQRSIVNSLVMMWAKIENQKPKKDKKVFHGDLVILLYEEPEALLHYDQEKKLLRTLEELARSSNSQVFICTHSSNLISTKLNALRSISRIVKVGGLTEVFKPKPSYLSSLESEKDNFDFTLWLNPDRNSLFFVDKVVLVEGSSDKAFLNYLIDVNNLKENLYVIDCGWKGNIPFFMKLAQEFGIRHLIMFDRDSDKNQQQKDMNNAITDSTNTFTIGIFQFVDTLEAYIGFDTKVDTYQKPIETLRQLRGKKLKEKHEREFIQFLEK